MPLWLDCWPVSLFFYDFYGGIKGLPLWGTKGEHLIGGNSEGNIWNVSHYVLCLLCQSHLTTKNYIMKQVIKFILKERGVNFLIALKAMFSINSEGSFTLYKSIKLSLSLGETKEDILYQLDWLLCMTKDFAQYR